MRFARILQDRIREEVKGELEVLGSRAFYVRATPQGKRRYKVGIWIEREVLESLVDSEGTLDRILEIIGRLEREYAIKIEEELKPLD
jgi:hypothetical protein